jgi:hypothetical protein
VDKLENLMLARSRQYKERKHLDKEMAKRKIAHLAERRKAKGEECKSLLKDDDNAVTEVVTDTGNVSQSCEAGFTSVQSLDNLLHFMLT